MFNIQMHSNHFRFLPHDMIVGGAALMSDTLHALGWLLVMDCTRGEVAYDHGGRMINDSNHVRHHQAALYDDVSEWVGGGNIVRPGMASLWKGQSGHMGATITHLGNLLSSNKLWSETRSSFIFWEFSKFSGNWLGSGKKSCPAIIISPNQKLFL